jgi:hypothetical protein
MGKIWAFKVFAPLNRNNEFEEWLNGLPIEDRAKIRTRIKYMEITETWKRPYFDKLHGYDKLHEIIANSPNVQNTQYRLFGCFGPERKEFTILIGVTKKNGNYTPRGAFQIAEKRRDLITDRRYINDYV